MSFCCYFLLILANVDAHRQIFVTKDITFSKESILREILGTTRFQCIHKCNRHGECKNIVFDNQSKACKLLRDIPTEDDENNKRDVVKGYSIISRPG